MAAKQQGATVARKSRATDAVNLVADPFADCESLLDELEATDPRRAVNQTANLVRQILWLLRVGADFTAMFDSDPYQLERELSHLDAVLRRWDRFSIDRTEPFALANPSAVELGGKWGESYVNIAMQFAWTTRAATKQCNPPAVVGKILEVSLKLDDLSRLEVELEKEWQRVTRPTNGSTVVDPVLDENTVKVLAYLAKCDGSAAQDQIAQRTNLSRPTVKQCLSVLEGVGFSAIPKGRVRGNGVTDLGRQYLIRRSIIDV